MGFIVKGSRALRGVLVSSVLLAGIASWQTAEGQVRVDGQHAVPTKQIAAAGTMRDNGDGTVTDLGSGLVWEKKPSTGLLIWSKAKAHCAGKGGGWRLPTISELRSLIRGCPNTMTGGACKVTDSCLSYSCFVKDDCWRCSSRKGPEQYGYHQDPILEQGIGSRFWSSPPRADNPFRALLVLFGVGGMSYEGADNPYRAWFVDFGVGGVSYEGVVMAYGVRCVRPGP